MPIIAFCEECGRKFVIEQEELDGRSIRIECPVCGEITVVSDEDIKVLTPKK